MYTLLYSVLHFLMDGICALSMVGWLTKNDNEYWLFLIYNLCLYLLQMPIGLVTDSLLLSRHSVEKQRFYMSFCYVGVVLTMIGSFTSPVLLGIGNAIFHIAGGAGTLTEDHANGWQGWGLGLFLAPGTMGLYLGKAYASAKNASDVLSLFLTTCGAIFLCCLGMELFLWFFKRSVRKKEKRKIVSIPAVRIPEKKKWDLTVLISCFLAVVLVSWMGLSVDFAWRKGITLGLLGVSAVMGGRVAGGFVIAKVGSMRALFLSVFLATVFYSFGNYALTGLFALFCFNMVLPLIWYVMELQFPHMPGFAFGFLSLGTFVGFMPVWFKMDVQIFGAGFQSTLAGAIGSLCTLAVLIVGVWMAERD